MNVRINRNDLLFFYLRKSFFIYLYVLALMTAARIAFLFYFGSSNLVVTSFQEVVQAFFYGWKYDTIVASYLLSPFFLGSILVSLVRSKKLVSLYNGVGKLYFYLGIFSIFVICCSDLGFYSYFQDRLNLLAFGLVEDDTSAVLSSIWENYPVGLIAALLTSFFLATHFVLKKTFHRRQYQRSLFHSGPFKFILMISGAIALLFGGARGGYGDLVLEPRYAEFSPNPFMNDMALNGVVSFEKAVRSRLESLSQDFSFAHKFGYQKGIAPAFSDFLGFDIAPTEEKSLPLLLERKTERSEVLEQIKPHVVVFIMESFGGSWARFNTDEFDFLGPLKKHMNEDIYFQNFISGENGTIGSLMVLATNLVHRPGAPYLSEGRYMQMPLPSAAHLPYQRNGYETTFIYGGKLGWRGIGKYFRHQNYDKVEGEEHIRESLGLQGDTHGNVWGLYDEHLFDFVLKKLRDAKKPQFILALSTTNHPPFDFSKDFVAQSVLSFPESVRSKVAREEELFMQRFKAFQYSNQVLSEFLTEVKTTELKENTVVSFTGDHNFWGFMNYTEEELFIKYQVPFYLYFPTALRPTSFDPKQLGSHQDIFPTLYHQTLSQTSYLALGHDLFSAQNPVAVNANILASKEGLVYKGSSYLWSPEAPYVGEKTDQELFEVNKYYRSSVSIIDFLLKRWSSSKE